MGRESGLGSIHGLGWVGLCPVVNSSPAKKMCVIFLSPISDDDSQQSGSSRASLMWMRDGMMTPARVMKKASCFMPHIRLDFRDGQLIKLIIINYLINQIWC